MFCDVIKSFIISLVQTTVSFAYNVTCKLFFGWYNHVFQEARLRKTHLHKDLRTAVYAFFYFATVSRRYASYIIIPFCHNSKKNARFSVHRLFYFLILCKVRNSIHIANVFKDWYCFLDLNIFIKTCAHRNMRFLFCYCYKTVYFYIIIPFRHNREINRTLQCVQTFIFEFYVR